MRKLSLLFVTSISILTLSAQNKVNPLIKSYGYVYEVPNAVEKPDPKLDYKLVIDITEQAPSPDSVNESLDVVARLVNLHILGGVPPSKLHVAVVVHNSAAFALVNDELYQKQYKTSKGNPNLPLVKALHDAGVEIFICGQTMAKRKIDASALSPEVKVSLSALTAITTHQMKGYALMKL